MRTYVRGMGQATILHADLDAFYASVEQRDDPRLRGRPVIVGLGVVLAASYEAKPYGLLVVPPERELAFLHPLPVERLWGVGPVTASKLHALGITTVGEVAELAESALVSMLGRASGRHLHALAHNRDPRPVHVRRRRRSIGSQRALGRTPKPPDEIDAIIIAPVDRVSRPM